MTILLTPSLGRFTSTCSSTRPKPNSWSLPSKLPLLRRRAVPSVNCPATQPLLQPEYSGILDSSFLTPTGNRQVPITLPNLSNGSSPPYRDSSSLASSVPLPGKSPDNSALLPTNLFLCYSPSHLCTMKFWLCRFLT